MQRELSFNYDYDAAEETWVAPTELPNLQGSDIIALDTETYDPHLMDKGAGWAFGDGHIVGVSVAVNNDKWYIPVKCETVRKGFDIKEVIEWVNRSFTKDTLMVGANLIYDLGWLTYHGAKLNCKMFDVQFAAPLLNEHLRTYALDSIASRYGLEGKDSGDLYRFCAARFGGKACEKQRANIYRAPLRLVGPYAEQDAALPLEIMKHQLIELEEQDLMEVCSMENALIPMLVAMRMRGVRVDMDARNKLSTVMLERKEKASTVIKKVAGYDLNVNAPTELAKVFDAHGWGYPLTDKTQAPSFKVGFLKEHESPFAQAVAEVKRINKLHGTFVDGYFSLAHKGRLHCNLHPLRNDQYGTVSGRFACLPDYVSITTDKGKKPLSEVVVGDKVLTHKGNYKVVLDKWLTGTKEVYRIKLTDTRTVDCTSNHKILTSEGWVSLDDMVLHPWLRAARIGKGKIEDIESIGVLPVYDMEIEGDHSFVANDVPVHNCSKPNIQNIPSRDPQYGHLIRGLFIPEDGEDWASIDYSAIELRMLAHYAIGTGSEEVRELYNKDPDTDFHQLVMDKTGLPRAPAKTVSFSLCYGSGVANTAELLGCTMDEAKEFRDKHFAGVPFMKATLDECMFRAAKRGWIRTTKGRLARFTEYEPKSYELSQELGSFSTKQECMDNIEKYTKMDNVNESHIKRARTYKALNSLLQGSAADLMKQAMVDIWNSGVLDVVGVPMITVHDELNFSVARTPEAREGMLEIKNIMEKAIKFRVPVRASLDYGKNWGEAH